MAWATPVWSMMRQVNLFGTASRLPERSTSKSRRGKTEMRILVLADIDDLRWQHGTGQADLILALGDVSDCLILEAAEAYGAPPIFGVKGNHCSPTPFPEGITDLHLRTVEFGGISFGGFPGSWRDKLRGHYLFEQDEAT